MLQVNKGTSTKINKHIKDETGVTFFSDAMTLHIGAVGDNIAHISIRPSDFEGKDKYTFTVVKDSEKGMDVSVNEKEAMVCMARLKLCINRSDGAITFLDEKGNILLLPDSECPYDMSRYELYENDNNDLEVQKIKTPDGVKEKITSGSKIFDHYTLRCRYSFRFDDREKIYGLGQFEEGYGSLRGNRLYLNQANRRIVIPYMISTRGYGMLFNMHSPLIFNDNAGGSYIYSSASNGIDFYFVNGRDISGAQRAYRILTGKAAMLPKWAFGYMQSQERYETQDEILGIADEYRKRGIGLDTVILDWCSWPDGMWGQKSFDRDRFPSPDLMIKKLHEKNVHFMISIWPNMNDKTENNREFTEKGLLLKNTDMYNAFDEKGRQLYWKQTNEGLYKYGVDGWWCDNSEPYDPSWTQRFRPEPSKLFEEYIEETANHMEPEYSNTFGYFHAMGVCEGQRKQDRSDAGSSSDADIKNDKRVTNLTRSAYLGSQKFGTIMWSGDIDAKWSVLKKQIASGLNFASAGMPYWTLDIGAFFVKKGDYWYWNGEYENGFDDDAYKELFVRWYWFGAFLPIFRGHGTDQRRELYLCTNGRMAYYDSLLRANRIRYELFYYIYSYAGRCYVMDENIINPLAIDFSYDDKACEISDQYMFGHELMICPVYEPAGDKDDYVVRRVYLPEGCGWYDYYTSCRFAGGQYIDVNAGIDMIPVFVKDGSVIPRTSVEGIEKLSTETLKKEIALDVYGSGESDFYLYDDAGDGYGYEKGEYMLKRLKADISNGKVSEEIINDGYNSEITISQINLI